MLRVGAASRRVGVSVSTMLRLEKKGAIEKPRRLGTQRVYSREDIEKIKETLFKT
jgi:DNA-binding transcriptional MerR regulator